MYALYVQCTGELSSYYKTKGASESWLVKIHKELMDMLFENMNII